MLSNILSVSELIRLRQDSSTNSTDTSSSSSDSGSASSCSYSLCDLMEKFDSKPTDAGDEDTNKTMGMV